MAINLKVLPKGSYKTKVKVLIPLDFDETEEVAFKVQFLRLITSKAITEFLEDVSKAVVEKPELGFEAEILRRAVQGWTELPGTESDVEFSKDALEELLGYPAYRAAMFKRFMEDHKPATEPARKN